MRKTFIVAQSEFGTLVRSKAFIITLVLMPVVMVASIYLAKASKNATDDKPRRFAYIDRTGAVGPVLTLMAAERNATAAASRVAPFEPVAISPEGRSESELRLELSDRIRKKELFAFVEIPADIADPDAKSEIRYYSDSPSYLTLPQWVRLTVNQAVLAQRFRAASVDPLLVARLTKQAQLTNLGLFERGAGGEITAAEKVDQMRAQGVPAVMLVLMYVTIMASAPQLLNSVIEEKMSRISEVLIGSVTPFELMLGKLFGCVAVSLVLAGVYIAGGIGVANYWGYADAIAPSMGAWFTLFLVLAGLLFGSIFIAIGAACTDLKDSQSMMTPVMVLVMLPVFTWAAVLRAPDSTLSLTLSLLPTAAPFLMLLRIGLQPGPPLWQILLSVSLMALTTLLAIWAAGRIFRTGLLMQGKSATVGEMIRWVRAG
jgi:ABC-2 type transport system permease protein